MNESRRKNTEMGQESRRNQTPSYLYHLADPPAGNSPQPAEWPAEGKVRGKRVETKMSQRCMPKVTSSAARRQPFQTPLQPDSNPTDRPRVLAPNPRPPGVQESGPRNLGSPPLPPTELLLSYTNMPSSNPYPPLPSALTSRQQKPHSQSTSAVYYLLNSAPSLRHLREQCDKQNSLDITHFLMNN